MQSSQHSHQHQSRSTTSVEDAKRVAERLLRKYDRSQRGSLGTNDMGVILRDIYSDARLSYSTSQSDEQSFFRILDQNRDSQVTLADLEQVCIKYLCNYNPTNTSYTTTQSPQTVIRQSYNPVQSSSYQSNTYQSTNKYPTYNSNTYTTQQQPTQTKTVQYGKTSQTQTQQLAENIATQQIQNQRRGSYLMNEVDQYWCLQKKKMNVPDGHKVLNSKNVFSQQGAQGMSSQRQQQLIQKAKVKGSHEVKPRGGQKQQQIQQECRSRRQNYTDPEFPPSLKSISDTGVWYDGGPVPSKDWIRPKDYFKNGFQLFEDGILPGDIKQGQLGDCYFQCALAAIAEWPERIQRIFTTQETNEEGVYSCWIVFNGVLQEVVVDDHLWYDAQYKELVSMCSNGDEIWPQIVEKCWAKLNKGYVYIDGGFARDALHDLTGAPVIHYRLKELNTWQKIKEILWDQLYTGEQNDFIMSAGTYGEDQSGEYADDTEDKDGILYSHAYSVLAAYEIQVQGRTEKLLKFRNPHGETEFNGRFSDKDPIWNSVDQQTKNRLGVTDEDDGVFFMQYEKVRDYFEDIQICQYRDHYYYHGERIFTNQGEQEHFFQVEVPETGYYYFQINQRARAEYGDDSRYQYTKATITVSNQNGQLISSCAGKQKNVCSYLSQQQPQQIQAGTYYVLGKVLFDFHQKEENIRSFGFGVYGKGKVSFKEVGANQIPSNIAQQLRSPSPSIHEILPAFVI